MSPALSFSAREILPALLKGMKTNWKEGKNQTIRPLWKTAPQMIETSIYPKEFKWDIKKPRLKVGDLCKLYWKQRSSPKGSRFCSKCGHELVSDSYMGGIYRVCPNECYDYNSFPKLMGTVRITEVFEIEMEKRGNGYCVYLFQNNLQAKFIDEVSTPDTPLIPVEYRRFQNNRIRIYIRNHAIDQLAKRDGFNSAEEMFRYFDKAYNLSVPRKFCVYRWEEL